MIYGEVFYTNKTDINHKDEPYIDNDRGEDMYQKKKNSIKSEKILLLVCICFLLGVTGGALAANIAGQSGKEAFALFLKKYLTMEEDVSFGYVFWKYLKYDLLIWVGGWLSMGIFLSGSICLFWGVSLGFTTAMMMASYGKKGVLLAMVGVVPQNLILIPVYLAMTSAAMYYLFAWEEEVFRQRAAKREKRKRKTEYLILLTASVVLICLASCIEIYVTPLLVKNIIF